MLFPDSDLSDDYILLSIYWILESIVSIFSHKSSNYLVILFIF